MESTERDMAMGDKGRGLGPDGREVITDPIIPEPKDVPAPPSVPA